MEKFEIQGVNGKFYVVDIESGICPCSGFAAKGACNHLEIARDIFVNHGKRLRWDIMSAYHKEIRRGDIKLATLWARVFARISGNEQVASYARKILFEETRNLDLLEKYHAGKLELRDQVRLIVRSRKKWECKYFAQHFEQWTEGFLRYVANKARWSHQTLLERVKHFSTPEEAYEILFYVQEKEDLLPVFWELIEKRAAKEKNKPLLNYLKIKPDGYYGKMVALELTIGYWSEEANEYAPDVEVKVNYVPRFEKYVYDVHQSIGKRRLIKYWPQVVQNKISAESKLDLRWSGMLAGILFRFKCFEQFGSMRDNAGRDIEWDKVVIVPELWSKHFAHDAFFYRDFYIALKKEGFDVPLYEG